MEPVSLMMERKMLRGIKQRAERLHAEQQPVKRVHGLAPLHLGAPLDAEQHARSIRKCGSSISAPYAAAAKPRAHAAAGDQPGSVWSRGRECKRFPSPRV